MLRRCLANAHLAATSMRHQSSSSSSSHSRGMSGFYNAGGTSPWFVYFQSTPNEDCMKFVIEGHEFLANMMPEDSAIYKAEQRRMNPPKAEAKAPFVVARREKLVAAAAAAAAASTTASATATATADGTPKPLVDLVSEEPYIDEDGTGASHYEQQMPGSTDTGSANKAEAAAAAADTSATDSTASTPASPKSPSVEQRVTPMTMTFNRDNGYLSPLANTLLEGIPDLIEDVTIGHHFITIRRAQLDELKWKYYDDDIEGERLLKEDEEKKKAKKAAAATAATAGMEGNSTFNTVGTGSASSSGSDSILTSLEVAEAMTEITNACALPAQLHAAGNNSGSAALKPERTDYSSEESEEIAVDGVEGSSSSSSSANGQSEMNEDDPDSEAIFRANYDPKRLERVLPIAKEQLNWSDLQLQISSILTDHMYSRKPHVTPDAPHPHADTLPKAGDSEALLAIKELIAGTIRPLVQEDGGDLRLVRFELLGDEEKVLSTSGGLGAATPSAPAASSFDSAEAGSCARTELPAASASAASPCGSAADPAFQQGRLHIEMLGACKSCKSSKTTLKDMIERTLQHWVPEVAEVVEVNMAKKASALGRSQK